MKQQTLEQEVVELKQQLALAGLLLDLATLAMEGSNKVIKGLRAENEALKGQNPTVGLGPSGASLDRELVNNQPNGFVPPKRYQN